MEKRKRKNDEPRQWSIVPLLAFGTGMFVLCLVTVFGIYIFLLRTQFASAFPLPLVPPTLPAVSAVSFTMPSDALLVVSTTDSDILTSSDGIKFVLTGMKGAEVAVSPRGGTLALWRSDTSNVHVYIKGKGYSLNLSGSHQIPTWSADGSLLFLSVLSSDQGGIFRFRTELLTQGGGPSSVGTFFLMLSPVVTTPSGDRILVTQLLSSQQTRLYTIDVLCTNSDDCKRGSRVVTIVPYVLTWATYEPSSGNIVFSEQGGNLYTLDVQTNKVSPFIVDTKKKSRPVFNIDGSRLAYLDDNGTLYLFNVSDKSTQIVPDLKIGSMSWVR